MSELMETMYRGFIRLKDKKAVEPFQNRDDLSSFETIRKHDGYGGVLAPGIALIDVDDFEQSEKLLQMIDDQHIQCSIVETGRGKHFLFMDPDLPSNKTKSNTAVGIKIDVKLGTKNSYQVLKHNGIKRKWIRKCEQPDLVPFWLKPIKNNVDFANLSEGDGRNQALFNYILTLQSEGYVKDEIKTIVKLINKFMLKTPLHPKEIDTILRDDSFKKTAFFKGNVFLHDQFAHYLTREYRIVKINQILHVYKDGVYSDKMHHIEAVMIKQISSLNQAKRREVLSYLELIAPEVEPAPVPYIALKNGIFDLSTETVIPFSPDIIIKNQIPIAYNPHAYDSISDVTLDKICRHDKDLRALLEEMIGYLMLRRNELGKSFILTGSGSNGKSTLLDMIKRFLGPDNYSSLALEELGQRFKTAELFGKLANLGDDIDSEYIHSNAVFKKLVTGETVNVERKGKDPFEFNNYGKLIFSANEMPRINDRTDGLMRRLVIIPFQAKFSSQDADFDPFIKDKLVSEQSLQYCLNLGIAGLKRVLTRKQFTVPDVVKQEMSQTKR